MITVTFTGADAKRAMRLMQDDDERAKGQHPAGGQLVESPVRLAPRNLPMAAIKERLLAVMPGLTPDLYIRAGLPKPWYRAGAAMRYLRAEGIVDMKHGGGSSQWVRVKP